MNAGSTVTPGWQTGNVGRPGRGAVGWLIAVALGLLVVTGARGGESTGLQRQPFVAGPVTADGPRFVAIPPATSGIDFTYRWTAAPEHQRLLNSSVVGGGVAAGDYDGDGLPDLCFSRPAGGCVLYRNLGGFHFTNVTVRAGLRTEGSWTTGVTFADVNGDGKPDLYVCCYDAPNQLYLNQGDGTFKEEARAWGLDYRGASLMMAFGDYDRDGRLDGYLLTGGLMPRADQRFRVKFVEGKPVVPEELREYWQLIYQPGDRAAAAEAGQADHLFHQLGEGRFEDVSAKAGLGGFDFGNAVLWWDYDRDGWPDLYVANDYFGPDRLYHNNRDGTFTDRAASALPRTPWTSMGADVGDLNRDGWPDLIASDMSGRGHRRQMIDSGDLDRNGWFLDFPEPRQYMRNAVYVNTGTGRFLELAYQLGVADTDWTWSVLLGDLDNDGWEDLFVANGMTRDWMDNDLAQQTRGLSPAALAQFWAAQPVRADRNLAFRNRGGWRFDEIATEWGLDQPGPTFGAVLVDLDRDGRLDLVANGFEAPARLLHNQAAGGHALAVQLRGRTNQFGIGATVRVETSDGAQPRDLSLAHGFMSAGEPRLHFGLGTNVVVDRLVVTWPDGHRQEFKQVPADACVTVSDSAGAAEAPTSTPQLGPTLMEASRGLDEFRHVPEVEDDFRRQPLLPWKQSTWGPGLAFGDLDGDGRDELYLAGTVRQSGAFCRFASAGQPAVKLDCGVISDGSELALLLLDANGDGALDLLVAQSGSAGGLRLWLNDGRGHFAPAPDATLPGRGEACGVVFAADFDRDGAVDLFIGGRAIPGAYPQATPSRLLRNDGGRWVDVTAGSAPALAGAGLVTSGVWSDVDDDGWIDLLVTTEWGPVRLYRNDHGRLVERTAEAGLAGRRGWWRGIAAADVDGDGAMDYVVTNLGLNTRYQPGAETPCRLYFGDFAGTGEPQLIEARLAGDGIWPMRGKAALEKAVPQLAERGLTHAAYAAMRLPELIGTSRLANAGHLDANCAESGVLRNLRNGRFEFLPLPSLAQTAPAFGVVAADWNGDGRMDLALVQNFHGAQRETGRMNGGVGAILSGRGDGTFDTLWPDRSGFLVAGDARGLALADLNDDDWPDLVATVHGDAPRVFLTRPDPGNHVLMVRLRGRRGNPTAIGARVTVVASDGVRRVGEIAAGGGYLSQSSAALSFGLGPARAERIEVRWPDGRVTRHAAPAQATRVRISEE